MSDTARAANQPGLLLEHREMDSRILGKKISHTVYLPAGYEGSEGRYPILYLLPGLDQDDADWFRQGGLAPLLDQRLAAGEMPPLIVASPDGTRPEGKRQGAFYMNNADGRFQWEDMFLREFMPHMEKTYRLAPNQRAIGGLSMGGFGALRFAFRYPELFPAAVGLSATIFTPELLVSFPREEHNRRFSYAYGNRDADGQARLNALYQANDPLALCRSLPPETLATLQLYLSCGGEDPIGLYEGNMVLHSELMRKGAAHHFEIVPGRHDWEFWRGALPGAMRFIGKVFGK